MIEVGSKPALIVGSLVCLIVVGLALLVLSGPVPRYWCCGLLLCPLTGADVRPRHAP